MVAALPSVLICTEGRTNASCAMGRQLARCAREVAHRLLLYRTTTSCSEGRYTFSGSMWQRATEGVSRRLVLTRQSGRGLGSGAPGLSFVSGSSSSCTAGILPPFEAGWRFSGRWPWQYRGCGASPACCSCPCCRDCDDRVQFELCSWAHFLQY